MDDVCVCVCVMVWVGMSWWGATWGGRGPQRAHGQRWRVRHPLQKNRSQRLWLRPCSPCGQPPARAPQRSRCPRCCCTCAQSAALAPSAGRRQWRRGGSRSGLRGGTADRGRCAVPGSRRPKAARAAARSTSTAGTQRGAARPHIVKRAGGALDRVVRGTHGPASSRAGGRWVGHVDSVHPGGPSARGALAALCAVRQQWPARHAACWPHRARTPPALGPPPRNTPPHSAHLANPTSASLAVRSRDSSTLRALTSKCVYVAEWR